MWGIITILVGLLVSPSFLLAQSAPTSTATFTFKSGTPSMKGGLKLGRLLKSGMSGGDVQALQEYLRSIPGIFPGGKATGFFGPATEKAVQKFQRGVGMARSGSAEKNGYGAVDAQTLAKINSAVARINWPAVSLPNLPAQVQPKNTEALAQSAPTAVPPTTKIATTTSTSSPRAATTTAPAAATISSATATSSAVASVPIRDTTPPIRSTGSPYDTLLPTTKEVKVSLVTNELAHCYWSSTPNTPFEQMSTAFTTTGGTMHSSTIRTDSAGDYAFYVKCRDRAMNANTSDYPILFSMAYGVSGADPYMPRVSMSSPTNRDMVAEGPINISAAASDNAGVAGVKFFLNEQDLHAEDMTPPFGVTVMLTPGAYSAFAVARDVNDNRATSTSVTFTVTSKSTAVAPSKTSPLSLYKGHTARRAHALALPQLNLASAIGALSATFQELSKLLWPVRQ